jgi:hypothetical protein
LDDPTVCVAAARGGCLEGLEHARAAGCAWDPLRCGVAAASGNSWECLEYAFANGCPRDESVAVWAARAGHTHCMALARHLGCPVGERAHHAAAKGGNVECLTWAYCWSTGGEWNGQRCAEIAARHGRAACLQFTYDIGFGRGDDDDNDNDNGAGREAKEEGGGNGDGWKDPRLVWLAAARRGNLAALMRSVRCGRVDVIFAAFEAAVIRGHRSVVNMFWNTDVGLSAWACQHAADHGRLWFLKAIRAHAAARGIACPWDEYTCGAAAANGRLRCLRYARANGCPWDERVCRIAAARGHLKCLEYAVRNGCPWEARTCALAAAFGGRLACLEYVHRMAAQTGDDRSPGDLWSPAVCAAAASGGHLDVLRYARENGCPWDERTCAHAAASGSIECLRYAREHGCPWDENAHAVAHAPAHVRPYLGRPLCSEHVVAYVESNGCPSYDQHRVSREWRHHIAEAVAHQRALWAARALPSVSLSPYEEGITAVCPRSAGRDALDRALAVLGPVPPEVKLPTRSVW